MNNSKKIIAFHDNNLCLRGTTANMFNMAKYNEEILGNKSIVVSFRGGNMDSLDKFKESFDTYLLDWWEYDNFMKEKNVDFLYLTKAGGNDGYVLENTKTIVHVVFRHNEPHGYKYVYISDWLAKDQGHYDEPSSLPYIVTKLPESAYDMREKLGIPKDAIVFGCYAGQTEFNINFVHDAIKKIVQERNDIYFIFMNINKFSEDHPNIIYLPGIWDMGVKASFVRACDAMIHARSGGETFGLAVAEFSIENKPVVTYLHSGEACHIELLGERGIYYSDYHEVYDILSNLKNYVKYDDYYRSYDSCSPERIMEKFNRLLNSDDENNTINKTTEEPNIISDNIQRVESTQDDQISFKKWKIKNIDDYVYTNDLLKVNTACYSLNQNEIKLIKSSDIILDNGIKIRIDHHGKIYEMYYENVKEISTPTTTPVEVSFDRPGVYSFLKSQGFNPKVIVDCGAAQGEWSGVIRNIFNHTNTIVGIDVHNWNNQEKINNTDITEYVLLSEEDGKEYDFYKKKEHMCTGDSIFRENTHHYMEHNTIIEKIKSTTLTEILNKHNLNEINLLKIDTQGSELLIMKGLGDKLRDIEFIELECSLVDYNIGGCTFYDILNFLKDDFEIFDIVELHRHNVRYLCQIDVVFQNKKSKIVKLK
jgi:FkbM family methyltransferase